MELVSRFYRNTGFFGYYPDSTLAAQLEHDGIDYVVDLTSPDENLPEYSGRFVRLRYPIRDGAVPTDYATFFILVSRIASWLSMGKRVYIHCRGGHSRSGLVAAAVLCILSRSSPFASITQITEAHKLRKNIRNKWKKVACPHHRHQRDWLVRHFTNSSLYDH
jgi:hypothetical protein